MSSVTETSCFLYCVFALLCADLFLVTGNQVMIVVVALGTNELKYDIISHLYALLQYQQQWQ